VATSSAASHTLSQLAYLLLSQEYPNRAAVIYGALNVMEPDVIYHLRGLALSCSLAGRHTDALAALDQLALKGQVDAPFYLLRARVLVDLQRPQEAQAVMKACVERMRVDARSAEVQRTVR
jgi:hypothetical protein